MYLTTGQCLRAIEDHTRGLAETATGNLDVPIEHCPGWSMADLVWHLSDVHRFWEHVARVRPIQQPQLPDRPRPGDTELIGLLLAGLDALLETLAAADQAAPCWTWGRQENVGFITRHQVQEAAVHHWDAAEATGAHWGIEPVVAMDSVEEFLTHSVANPRWPVPDAAPLGGDLWFCPCGAESEHCPRWRIHDGALPGTIDFSVDEESEAPLRLEAHVAPGDLLLWLYRRLPEDDPRIFEPEDLDPERRALIERFRALTFTD